MMKPVIIAQIIKRRFSKGELVNLLYSMYSEVTTIRELKRIVQRENVVEYGEAVVDIYRRYGNCIEEETIEHQKMATAEAIGEKLGLEERLEEYQRGY